VLYIVSLVTEVRLTNAEKILAALATAGRPLSDGELATLTGIAPPAQVNQICNKLARAGRTIRHQTVGGPLLNSLPDSTGSDAAGHDSAEVAAGSSYEQREAEAVILRLLGERLGVSLEPRRLAAPSGASIDVDGISPDGSVLAECWAHQGSAKVAQKYKLMNDAIKLFWAASWLAPTPSRLILCVTDEAAVKHLRGRSWQGQALSHLGVDIEVVPLPDDVVASIIAAQKRQFARPL
jgi:hypothetical protein